MSMTIHTSKKKKKPAQSPVEITPEVTDLEVLALVEQFGEAQETLAVLKAAVSKLAKVKELAQKTGELAELQKKIVGHVIDAAVPVDMARAATSDTFTLAIGEGKLGRSITDKAALIKLLGRKNADAISHFNLGDLDDYLTLPQREKVITSKRDGDKRSFKVTRIETK